MPDTGDFRGEGGVVWTLDLPLSETMAEQVAKGQLKPLDAPAVEAVAGPVEPPRHGKGSSTEAWRDYAELIGLPFPSTATRDDIITLVDQVT